MRLIRELNKICVLSLAALCSVTHASTESNWHARVEKWLWRSSEIDIRTLSAEDRTKVITELRVFAADPNPHGYGNKATFQLVRLGDEQTIEKVMQDFRSDDTKRIDDAKGVLANVNTPLLIPSLAELLYHPEGVAAVMPPDSDVGYYTRPLWAASRMMNIIGARTEFRPEVKSWISSSVESLRGRVDYATYWCIRQLWEENKEAFLRKDYAAVKPPKTVRLPESPARTNQVPPAATPVPTNIVTPPVKETPPASAPTESSALPLPLFIGLGALALVAVVVVMWKGKRRKAKE